MNKASKQIKSKNRIRAKVRGTKDRPRLSVFRSNRFVYAQIINDEVGKTIVGISEKEFSEKTNSKKVDKAKALGVLLAKKAIDKKLKKVVFDRGRYPYHGRIKALADGAREGGLEF